MVAGSVGRTPSYLPPELEQRREALALADLLEGRASGTIPRQNMSPSTQQAPCPARELKSSGRISNTDFYAGEVRRCVAA